MHATAVTASQSMPAETSETSAQRAYNGHLLQLLRALHSGSTVRFVLVQASLRTTLTKRAVSLQFCPRVSLS